MEPIWQGGGSMTTMRARHLINGRACWCCRRDYRRKQPLSSELVDARANWAAPKGGVSFPERGRCQSYGHDYNVRFVVAVVFRF